MIDELINEINYNTKNKIYDVNNRIYAHTNENLLELFNNYNVKDKKVLTVLASSDQFLSCLYNNAKEIDTFDRSYITNFYYYLRKWLILYNDTLYPSITFFNNGDLKIYELVKNVRPINIEEKKAKLFWLKYLKSNNHKGNKYTFESIYCKGITPFTNNIDSIKNKLPDKINFYCLNFFNNVNINKKYDVIILSNMLEYLEHDDNNEKKEIVRKNLENLLNDDGIAICSYKTKNRFSNFHLNERDILTKNKLVLDKETKYYEPLFGSEIELAYSYRKIV